MAVIPRHASTVVLMRDGPGSGDKAPQVLLVRRHAKADFAANAYVFPGGVLEEEDYSQKALALVPPLAREIADALARGLEQPEMALGLVIAAIRETFEEVGVLLARTTEGATWWPPPDKREEVDDARRRIYGGELDFVAWVEGQGLRPATEDLVFFAHWITPAGRPKRFDTRFFLAPVPAGMEAHPDRKEVFDRLWIAPAEAIGLAGKEEIKLMTPTLRNLELLAAFSSVGEAREALLRKPVSTILPKIGAGPGGERIVLHPGEPGYDNL